MPESNPTEIVLGWLRRSPLSNAYALWMAHRFHDPSHLAGKLEDWVAGMVLDGEETLGQRLLVHTLLQVDWDQIAIALLKETNDG